MQDLNDRCRLIAVMILYSCGLRYDAAGVSDPSQVNDDCESEFVDLIVLPAMVNW